MVRAACLAVACLAAAGCVRWTGAAASPPLLPDLDQVAPYDVSVIADGGRELLVFASAVENVGRGTLLLDARRDRLTDPMEVRQLVRRADGSTDARPVGSVLRYVRSETHSHWHLENFERYSLRELDGTKVGRDRKTGFCLGDRYERRGWDGDAEPPRAVLVGECRKGDPAAFRVRQGISPGYGDDYDPLLEGQSIDVTGLAPGRYVLVHVADPDRLLDEETRENNAASALVELERTADGPTVAVIRTCPEAATCP